MSAPRVSLRRQADYGEALKASLDDLLAPLGGMGAFLKRGDKVVLKPNLVIGFSVKRAVTTHPAVVRAVAELALDCGARVTLGDSPGFGSARKVAASCGILPVAEALGVEVIEFAPVDHVDETRTFKRLTLARELLEADVVVNLPKLKTHAQMNLTMAVKNLFGAVVGAEKFQWHYRAGLDKLRFATMLYEICRAVGPRLTVVDAVVGMDGMGPTNGKPNPLGFLAAGADPCAVDAVLCDIVGVERQTLWTLRAAAALGDTAWQEATTVGEDPAGLKPARWNMPATQTLSMTGPLRYLPGIDRWLRKRLTAFPVPIPEKCVRCGACVRVCAAGAMTLPEGELPRLDRKECIQCYCCHELCPHGAMELKRGWLGRWVMGR